MSGFSVSSRSADELTVAASEERAALRRERLELRAALGELADAARAMRIVDSELARGEEVEGALEALARYEAAQREAERLTR